MRWNLMHGWLDLNLRAALLHDDVTEKSPQALLIPKLLQIFDIFLMFYGNILLISVFWDNFSFPSRSVDRILKARLWVNSRKQKAISFTPVGCDLTQVNNAICFKLLLKFPFDVINRRLLKEWSFTMELWCLLLAWGKATRLLFSNIWKSRQLDMR